MHQTLINSILIWSEHKNVIRGSHVIGALFTNRAVWPKKKTEKKKKQCSDKLGQSTLSPSLTPYDRGTQFPKYFVP